MTISIATERQEIAEWAPPVTAAALTIGLGAFFFRPGIVLLAAWLVAGAALALFRFFRRSVATSSWKFSQEDLADTAFPWVQAFAAITGIGIVTKSDVQEAIAAVAPLVPILQGLMRSS